MILVSMGLVIFLEPKFDLLVSGAWRFANPFAIFLILDACSY